MNNFLLFIAALLVLVLSALFAAPWFVDWNDYKHVLEQQASRLVGRQVNVGGEVSLTFLPKPVLRFENINVADEQGGFDAPFLSARSLTVWLAVPPLLRGVVEARDVALDQPILNLQIGPDGKGNWRDVGRPDVNLPFMPREVALDAFRIMDATVTLSQGSDQPYLTLDHLHGELSARSLQGPYKFAGDFEVAGEKTQLRFSTGRREADGGIRLKAVLVNDGGRAFYTVDGMLKGFDSAPRFAGDFEAQFVDAQAEPPAAQPQTPAMGPEPAPPLLIKAKVEADPVRAHFTEIEAAIRRSNKPQTITGEMKLAYAGELAVDASLSSRWLDLDSLNPQPEGEAGATAGPMPAVSHLTGRFLGATSAIQKLAVDVSVDQAVLSGDLVHDVDMALSGGRGSLAVERFSARLPGEADLSLAGKLLARDGAPAFEGRGEISGLKLNRLLGWAGLDTGSVVAAQEGAFSLKGDLTAAPNTLAIEEASGQLFGSRFTGGLRYSAGETRRFDLTLKSDRLDLGRIGGSWVDRLTIPALLRGDAAGDPKPEEGSTPGWLKGAEARLDVDIGAVTLPGMGETALSAGMDIDGDNVSVRTLKLASDEGLRIEANGSLSGLEAKPSGSIAFTAKAESKTGVQALARLLELDAVAGAEDWRLRAMTPATISGSIRSVGGGKQGLSAVAKGTIGGNDLVISAGLEGRLADWKEGQVALDVRLRSASTRTLLAQLSSRIQEEDLALFANDGGVLAVRLKGVPSDGLQSWLDFSGGGIALNATGTLTAREERFDFAGDAKIRAANGAALLTLAGGHLSPAHSGKRLDLKAELRSSGHNYEISGLAGSAGDIRIAGGGRLDLSAERPRVELDLQTSAASLPFLFEPLIGWNAESASAPSVVRGVSRSETFWPEESLDTALLDSFDGALKLKSKSMRLAGPLSMTDASLDASLDNGVLEIARIEGRLLGGTAAGQATFTAEAGGLNFKAGAGARGLLLDRVLGGEGLAKGKLDVELELESQGLSPRGIAAGLGGKGRLTFTEGRIARLEPQTPKKAAAGLAGDAAADEDKLVASIRRELSRGSFAFRPFEADVRVRNGVGRVEKVKLDAPSGSAVVTTFLEFATLKLDSEWLLVSGKAEDEEAPRITLAFAGPLAELGEMKPQIDADALQRHATIRRMERDVERLEKLEVPGAPKRREPPAQEQPAAAATTSAVTPRAAAVTNERAPAPARKPDAPEAPRKQQAPAEPSGDAVVSRPLPPAAPPSRVGEPAPAPPAQQPPSQLPWAGQQQPSYIDPRQQYYDPRQAYDPRQRYQPPPQTQGPTPPAAVPESPPPPPQPEPARKQEWNPFRQDF